MLCRMRRGRARTPQRSGSIWRRRRRKWTSSSLRRQGTLGRTIDSRSINPRRRPFGLLLARQHGRNRLAPKPSQEWIEVHRDHLSAPCHFPITLELYGTARSCYLQSLSGPPNLRWCIYAKSVCRDRRRCSLAGRERAAAACYARGRPWRRWCGPRRAVGPRCHRRRAAVLALLVGDRRQCGTGGRRAGAGRGPCVAAGRPRRRRSHADRGPAVRCRGARGRVHRGPAADVARAGTSTDDGARTVDARAEVERAAGAPRRFGLQPARRGGGRHRRRHARPQRTRQQLACWAPRACTACRRPRSSEQARRRSSWRWPRTASRD